MPMTRMKIPLLGSKAMLNMATLASARNIIENYIKLRQNETVLIVTDSTKLPIADILSYAVIEVNGESASEEELSMSIMIPRQERRREPPKCVAQAMKSADVILMPTRASMTFTKATREALSNARIGSMPGVNENMMLDGGLQAELSDIKTMTDKVANALLLTEEYRVTSPNKTNLVFRRDSRPIFRDNGDLSEKGKFGNLPAGEACFAIVEETAKGILVIDRMGETITSGVRLTIEKGRVVDCDGPSRQSFMELIESAKHSGYSDSDVVAEFGIGTNPTAKYVECEVESEKMYGTVHFGFGGNATLPGGKVDIPFHHDGIVLNAKLEINQELVLEGRRFYI
jgi:leucyl aminopeptidase (aminopeptidase T)